MTKRKIIMTNGINYEVHGCVEVHSEYGSNVERVEDDREAEFFTAYNWDGDSIQWAVQDFNSRLEAEAWVKAAERGDVLNLRDRGIRWQVRVIREGDRYGLDGQLTRENGTPYVEFWDMDQFKGVGQFVSRYYLDTIKEIPMGQGLNLHGGVHRWQVSGKGMRTVLKFLQEK